MSKGPADSHLIKLGRQFEQAWSQERQVSRDTTASENAVSKAVAAVRRIVRRIETTPAKSLAGLRVKARAVAWCHGGRRNVSLREKPTTDVRLAQSIIADLLAA